MAAEEISLQAQKEKQSPGHITGMPDYCKAWNVYKPLGQTALDARKTERSLEDYSFEQLLCTSRKKKKLLKR